MAFKRGRDSLMKEEEPRTKISDGSISKHIHSHDSSTGSTDGHRTTPAKEEEEWIAPDPVLRPTFFSGGGEDPLAQLERYILSHGKLQTMPPNNNDTNHTAHPPGNAGSNNNNNNNNNTPNHHSQQWIASDADELLTVAEFLFGTKALVAALGIVDARRTLVTRLVAPSGRSVHIVRSAATSNSRPSLSPPGNLRDHSHNKENRLLFDSNGGETQYLCLLSPDQSSSSTGPCPIRYCSCRSFLEKTTKKMAALPSLGAASNRYHHTTRVNDEEFRDGPPVCKHLLALFLLPHLAAAATGAAAHRPPVPSRLGGRPVGHPEIRCVSEREFADILLERVL